MQKIIATVGLPASGKTTFSTHQKHTEFLKIIRDELRFIYFGQTKPIIGCEDILTRMRNEHIINAAQKGVPNIIVDETNYHKGNLTELADLAEELNYKFVRL